MCGIVHRYLTRVSLKEGPILSVLIFKMLDLA